MVSARRASRRPRRPSVQGHARPFASPDVLAFSNINRRSAASPLNSAYLVLLVIVRSRTFTCSPLKQMDRVHRLLPLANWLPAARLALALATARYPGCLDPLTPPVALVFQCCFGCYSRVEKRRAPLPSPPAIPRPAHRHCARGLAPSCEPGHTRFASPPPSQLALPAPLVPLIAPLRPTLSIDVGEEGTT